MAGCVSRGSHQYPVSDGPINSISYKPVAVLWLLKLTFGDLWRSGSVLTPRGEEVGFALISRASPVRTDGGAEGIRTPDPHNAIVVLYQLSYDPNQSVRRARYGMGYGFVKSFSGQMHLH